MDKSYDPQQTIKYLEFMLDWTYESLGPANDDIMEMAREEWRKQGNIVPYGYGRED